MVITHRGIAHVCASFSKNYIEIIAATGVILIAEPEQKQFFFPNSAVFGEYMCHREPQPFVLLCFSKLVSLDRFFSSNMSFFCTHFRVHYELIIAFFVSLHQRWKLMTLTRVTLYARTIHVQPVNGIEGVWRRFLTSSSSENLSFRRNLLLTTASLVTTNLR